MFGVVATGAPGAGKSTLVAALADAFQLMKRPTLVVNLDPANDVLPYKCDIDIRQLITVSEVMERMSLGPNGALRYCIGTLAANCQWLMNQLDTKKKELEVEFPYVIFDAPGQLELFSTEGPMSVLLNMLQKSGARLAVAHLNDSLYCSDVGKFLAVAISSLAAMVNLELPHINVLSKVDLLPHDIPFGIDFFQQLPDLSRLVDLITDIPGMERYSSLNAAVASVLSDFDLLAFSTFSVLSRDSMAALIRVLDSANGFIFADAKDLRELITEQ